MLDFAKHELIQFCNYVKPISPQLQNWGFSHLLQHQIKMLLSPLPVKLILMLLLSNYYKRRLNLHLPKFRIHVLSKIIRLQCFKGKLSVQLDVTDWLTNRSSVIKDLWLYALLLLLETTFKQRSWHLIYQEYQNHDVKRINN